MSARHPVTIGHDAYAAVLAAGGTRAEAMRAHLRAREQGFEHDDAEDRAELLDALLMAGFEGGLHLGALEARLGLRDRALSDGTTPTARLREALATLRGDAP